MLDGQQWPVRRVLRIIVLAGPLGLVAVACQNPAEAEFAPGVIIDSTCEARESEPPSERAAQGLAAVTDRDQEIYPQLVIGTRETIGAQINFGEALTDGIVRFRIPVEPVSLDVDSDGEWLRDPEHPESLTEQDATDLGWVALEIACDADYRGVHVEYVDYE